MLGPKSLCILGVFFTFSIHIFYFGCSQASPRIYSFCTKLTFDFTVCMLCNPAPPPFAVSKYSSVTLPLNPTLCDKGCAPTGEQNAKFLWVTVPSGSGVLITNLPSVIGESIVRGTLDQMTESGLASWEASTSLGAPNLLLWKTSKEENKEMLVRLGLDRRCLHLFEKRGQWYLWVLLQAAWPLGHYFISACSSLWRARGINTLEKYLTMALQSSCSCLAFRGNTL